MPHDSMYDEYSHKSMKGGNMSYGKKSKGKGKVSEKLKDALKYADKVAGRNPHKRGYTKGGY